MYLSDGLRKKFQGLEQPLIISPDNAKRHRLSVTDLSVNKHIPPLYRITASNRCIKKKTNISRWSTSIPDDAINEDHDDEYDNDDKTNEKDYMYGVDETPTQPRSPKKSPMRKPMRKTSIEFIVPSATKLFEQANESPFKSYTLRKPMRKVSMDTSPLSVVVDPMDLYNTPDCPGEDDMLSYVLHSALATRRFSGLTTSVTPVKPSRRASVDTTGDDDDNDENTFHYDYDDETMDQLSFTVADICNHDDVSKNSPGEDDMLSHVNRSALKTPTRINSIWNNGTIQRQFSTKDKESASMDTSTSLRMPSRRASLECSLPFDDDDTTDEAMESDVCNESDDMLSYVQQGLIRRTNSPRRYVPRYAESSVADSTSCSPNSPRKPSRRVSVDMTIEHNEDHDDHTNTGKEQNNSQAQTNIQTQQSPPLINNNASYCHSNNVNFISKMAFACRNAESMMNSTPRMPSRRVSVEMVSTDTDFMTNNCTEETKQLTETDRNASSLSFEDRNNISCMKHSSVVFNGTCVSRNRIASDFSNNTESTTSSTSSWRNWSSNRQKPTRRASVEMSSLSRRRSSNNDDVPYSKKTKQPKRLSYPIQPTFVANETVPPTNKNLNTSVKTSNFFKATLNKTTSSLKKGSTTIKRRVSGIFTGPRIPTRRVSVDMSVNSGKK